jgi:ribosomal protein L14E/L6E/L27E
MADTVQTGDVVWSRRGRDAGKRFLVLGVEDEWLFLADGRLRRVETPKAKKRKHAEFCLREDNLVRRKLDEGQRVTNNDVRRTLNELCGISAETMEEESHG